MKALIVSDIHGCRPALDAVLAHYDRWGCDRLLLLGDLLNYGPRNGLPEGLDPLGIADVLNRRAADIVAVRGNCDSEVDQMLLHFPIMADYAVVGEGGTDLFLTHGHIYNEERLPQAPSCGVFVYGHTHLQTLRPATNGRPAICNTGSITFPKGGNPPTFALLDGRRLSIRLMNGEPLSEIEL